MLKVARSWPDRDERERGSALIAALAVALIGMALASVVVSSVIVASRDSGKDRGRTTQVHTAEGAVDAVFAELELGTPCEWPVGGGSMIGNTSPSATTARATVEYFNAAGAPLTCASGSVTGGPVLAVVTATAQTAGPAQPGGATKRTIQAKVVLTPLAVTGQGAAIFAGNAIMTTNNFNLTSATLGTPADIWVDSGNVNCNSGVLIDGNLIVVNGTADFSGACRVTGDLWSKGKISVTGPQSGGLTTVGLNTYGMFTGLNMLAGGAKFGGNVSLRGTVDTWGSGPILGGSLRTGLAASQIPSYVQVGLPEINYVLSDWAGFVTSGNRNAAYKQWVIDNAVANNAPTWSDSRNPAMDQCTVQGASYGANGPLVGPSVPTVFDTRPCAQTKFSNGFSLKLRSDLVIFANDFYATGNFSVTSADGLPHQLWIIVPDPDLSPSGGDGECGKTVGGNKSGNIKYDSGSNITAPITVFMYTPCKLETNNSTAFYGQLYGGNVTLRNDAGMRYVPIGVPGVDFTLGTPVASSGYRVDIVYKREIKTP
ncbi:hypothetical protein [Pengzhenrongella frigida]|uniref:Uncharacterized protein n=1 Tax=Pengzhenrongella frigida TaxID=1259133 RepID=A0A4Q5N3Y7_9MICO|nr:hypothetical protein [Cellulomonas sp. HLT2-17]RYV52875.1 hypothetical protein EUA98_01380 [Cellulomonas sp. HLT2-17]